MRFASIKFNILSLRSPSIAGVQHSSCRCMLCDDRGGVPSKWACPERAPGPRRRRASLVAGSPLAGVLATRKTHAGKRRRRYSNRLATDAPNKASFP